MSKNLIDYNNFVLYLSFTDYIYHVMESIIIGIMIDLVIEEFIIYMNIKDEIAI